MGAGHLAPVLMRALTAPDQSPGQTGMNIHTPPGDERSAASIGGYIYICTVRSRVGDSC